MSTKLSDIFDHLLRPEFKTWKVQRLDENLKNEDFDPLTLIESFLESGMDLRSAFDLFDQVIQKIAVIVQDGLLTYKQINTTVIQSLLTSDNPKALIWLSNYENIFGPDLNELKPEQGYVIVRNASELKKNILNILGEMTGRTSTKELKEYLGAPELREMTENLIKLIRYSGFYKVKSTFLKAFCEELAERSIKGFLPNLNCDEKTIQKSLDSAENLLLMAREESKGDINRAINLLELSLEEVGSIALKKFGLLPFSATRQSFTKFMDQLKIASESRESSLPQLNKIRAAIVEALRTQNIPLKTFLNECNDLIYSINKRFIVRACRQAAKTIKNLHIILLPDKKLANLHTFDDTKMSTKEYLEVAATIFSESGIPTFLENNGEWIDISIDFSFHELLEFGRKVRFRALFTQGDEFHGDWLNLVVEDLKNNADIIAVIISNINLSKKNIKELNKAVKKNHRTICIISREQFEKTLRRPQEIRDLILDQFEILVPEAQTWHGNIFGEEKFHLPNSLKGYEKLTIEEALAKVSCDRASEACMNIARVLESVIREHALFICALLDHGIKKSEKLFASPIEPKNHGMGGYIAWFQELVKYLATDQYFRKLIGAFLPNTRMLKDLHSLREYRNIYAHMEREVPEHEARTFIYRVSDIVGTIQEYKRSMEKAVFIEKSGKVLVFYTEAGIINFSRGIKHAANLHLEKGCCVYINDEEHFYPIIHAQIYCEKCKKLTPLDKCLPTGGSTCSECKSKIQVERTWHRLVKKADSAEVKDKKKIIEKKSLNSTSLKQRSNDSRLSNRRPNKWLRALAETVATAAGPFGAILQGLMSVQDQQKEEELDKQLENLIRGQEDIKAELFKSYLSGKDYNKNLVNAISDCMAEYLNTVLKNKKGPDDLYKIVAKSTTWPFVSLTRIEEKTLTEELCNLYAINMELFYADLVQTGYPISRIKRTGTPEVDILNFVVSLRRQSPELLPSVFESFAQKFPASDPIQIISLELAHLTSSLSLMSEETMKKK